MSSTAIHRMVADCQAGARPNALGRVPGGWVILGEIQIRSGYCLLLPDPVVPHLNALTGEARAVFLDSMIRVGDAVLAVTGAARINYEMLGNLEPALHAHILPRSLDEPEAVRTKPIWLDDWDAAPRFDPDVHGQLRDSLRAALVEAFGDDFQPGGDA
jgi:diadenosine tetraphosphate (Ap4A) HIT family hydrolase